MTILSTSSSEAPLLEKDPLLRTGYRAVLIILLMMSCLLNFADRAILAVVVEPMRHELGLSDIQIGLLQGLAFAVTYSLMGIPVGRLAERNSRIRIIALAVIFFSASTGLCGLATSFLQLFLLRISVGVGEGGFMAPATSLLADHYPANRRASALALVMLGMPFGFLLGTLVGGRVAEVFGWRATFFVMSAPGLVVAALLLLLLREPPRGLAEGLSTHQKSTSVPSLSAVCRYLFGLPAFRHLLAAVVLCTCGLNAVGQYQYVFFVRVHELSLSAAGAISGLISFSSLAVGMLSGGKVVDWIQRYDVRWYLWAPAIGSFVGSIFYAAGFAQTQLVPGIVLILMGGFFVFFYFAPSYAVVQNISGVKMRTSAVAVFGMFSGLLGAGLGPTIAGFASEYFSRAAFAVGTFSELCPGGRAVEIGSAIDRACQAATASGMRGAMIIAAAFLLWGALHFVLASRKIGDALKAGHPSAPERTLRRPSAGPQ